MQNELLMETQGFTKELLLLLEILGSPSVNEIHLLDVDWDEIVELSLHHRVFPTLYVKLKGLNSPNVPLTAMNKLQSKYFENGINMLRLSSELEKINNAFISHHIQSILLKGPLLALILYGDLSLRTSKDLDILVKPQHLSKAEEVLTTLGYITKEEKVLGWKRKKHHISYYHPVSSTQIELHWSTSNRLRGMRFKELWQRRITITLTGNPINYLSHEDLFIYLVSHGARHGWFRLRWLYDIDRMINKGIINEKKLDPVYSNYGGQYIGGQALLLCSALFSTNVPQELLSLIHNKRSHKLAQRALFFIKDKIDLSSKDDKSVVAYHKRYHYTLLTTRQKILLAIDYLYPSNKDFLVLPLPKILHFLYFPLRPFLWCWRRMKRETI